MIKALTMAVRRVRAALRHARNSRAGRPPPDVRRPTGRPGPDLVALAALVLGGVIDPVDALFVTLAERDRHLDH